MLERNIEDRWRSRAPEQHEMTQTHTEFRRFEGLSCTPEEYAGYEVLDPVGQKIGSAEKLFFNQNVRPEYIRVRIGLLLARHIRIPVEDVALNKATRALHINYKRLHNIVVCSESNYHL